MGTLLAMALIVASLQVSAETQLGGRDFNHNATGFPLSGGHATAACETCHAGGVFKGTPRSCDACHTVGKRVVATPKSNVHLVTDAPCESCHFNTSTWLGARYNHGTARPGQCATCHNGRTAEGKHAKHVATTFSCDQCHRPSSWIPASWNHTNSALATYSGAKCDSCHAGGGMASNKSVASTPGHFTYPTLLGITFSDCRSCHTSYYSFLNARYDHATSPATCQNCHTGQHSAVKAKVSAIHNVAAVLPLACNSCHKNYVSFAPARYDHAGATVCSNCHIAGMGVTAKDPTHIPDGAAACQTCHVSTASWTGVLTGSASHANYAATTPTCFTCHSGGTYRTLSGRMRQAGGPGWFHELDRNPAATDCSSAGCHQPGGISPTTGKSAKGVAYVIWD